MTAKSNVRQKWLHTYYLRYTHTDNDNDDDDDDDDTDDNDDTLIFYSIELECQKRQSTGRKFNVLPQGLT